MGGEEEWYRRAEGTVRPQRYASPDKFPTARGATSMSWKKLMGLSAIVIAVVIMSITSIAPAEAQSACGRFNGLLCRQTCNDECSNGSCCDWSYYYYENGPN